MLHAMSPQELERLEKEKLGIICTAEATDAWKQQQIDWLLRGFDLGAPGRLRIRRLFGIRTDEERGLVAQVTAAKAAQDSAQHAKSSARAAWWSIPISLAALMASVIALLR